jgi:hypothetical protein
MKKIFVAIIALAVLCNLAAATWNVGQYDAAMNDAQRILDNQYRRQQAEFDQNYKRSEQQRLIDNEMNRRKEAQEQLKYDRKRQSLKPYGSTSSSSYRKLRSGGYDNSRYNPHPYTETRTGSYGQTYYVGPKSGEYYVNKNGNRTYYTKVPKTQPVYTGPQGGSYYYNTSGKKRYIRSK